MRLFQAAQHLVFQRLLRSSRKVGEFHILGARSLEAAASNHDDLPAKHDSVKPAVREVAVLNLPWILYKRARKVCARQIAGTELAVDYEDPLEVYALQTAVSEGNFLDDEFAPIASRQVDVVQIEHIALLAGDGVCAVGFSFQVLV